MVLTPCMCGLEGRRVERDNCHCSDDHEDEGCYPEGRHRDRPPPLAAHIVFDADTSAVDSVQQRESEEQEVVDLPEWRAPAISDEGVVDLINSIDDVHDHDVQDGQKDQQ